MTKAIRIGIIGDFEPAYHSDFATNAALYDAATKLNVPLMVRWIAKPTLDNPRLALHGNLRGISIYSVRECAKC